MSLDYFYSPKKNISGDTVHIEGDEFLHLAHVMRKREGERVRVVDGEGTAYDVELTNLTKKVAEGRILETFQNHNESECSITLAVSILKNPSRFDFLIEKVTELGVKDIIPLHTERTIPSHAKVERWQKLALAAMKQSCRSYLPKVRSLATLDALAVTDVHYEQKIFCHEKSDERFFNIEHGGKQNTSVLLLIGPEGGFSEEEVTKLLERRFRVVSLGERRLRTETAAIVAVSLFTVPNK
ncbi:MAG: 16S rRNA (uracil(1498)-N(3))-methyltransferase [Ignavibacteriae bacterium]|nr:16S rRNA (uracil(1498)-N(3))-methyltransferase [Ignavibacteriota bacterium]